MASHLDSHSRVTAMAVSCAAVMVLAGLALSHHHSAGASPVANGKGTNDSTISTPPLSDSGTVIGSPSMIAWPPFVMSHTTFVAQGLSNTSGFVHAYALNPAAVWDINDIKRAAAAFALDGLPRHQGSMWQVGGRPEGASLSVQADGWASLMYSNGFNRGCAVAVPESGGATSGGAISGGAAPGCAASPNQAGGSTISSAAARAKVASLLSALQPSLTSMRYTVNSDQPSGSTWVTAQAVVDGQLAGVRWNAAFVGHRLTTFSGPLAPIVDLSSFAVIGPRAAVARLSDPRFGPLMNGPVPLMNATAGTMSPAGTAPVPGTTVAPLPKPAAKPPVLPSAGSAITWPVTTETITSAVLVRQPLTTPSGAVLLVPTYQLSSTDHRTWQVIAVADSGLDFSPPPVATPAPVGPLR